jgi:hypothetical protein
MKRAMSDAPAASRPTKPTRPYPLTGEENTDWHAWWNACDACQWSRPDGCARGGALTYESGATRWLLSKVRGGCADWSARDA